MSSDRKKIEGQLAVIAHLISDRNKYLLETSLQSSRNLNEFAADVVVMFHDSKFEFEVQEIAFLVHFCTMKTVDDPDWSNRWINTLIIEPFFNECNFVQWRSRKRGDHIKYLMGCLIGLFKTAIWAVEKHDFWKDSFINFVREFIMAPKGPITVLESSDDLSSQVKLQIESLLGEVVKAFFQPKPVDSESLQLIKSASISRLFTSIDKENAERGQRFDEMAPCFLGKLLLQQINWAAFSCLNPVQQASVLSSSLIALET